MNIIGIILLLALLTGTTLAQTEGTVTTDTFATTTKEAYQELIGYKVDKDKEAFVSTLEQYLLDGTAKWIYKGDKVYLKGCEGWLCELVRIRYPGDSKIYYTATENIDTN